ncbi:SagB/ThcOx family dehydrogenase [Candidatus Korarchaeum cryptofilum]|uniref:NAD(P)H-flavin oxidoreductase n=1 Tax=Korarchaeum cryptofilum (strain OPF8) TaxID=374847 RepID=B1L5G3_KORCO|nr:NAD(P)H-flavin oxidoreductase [Candidatus Korarchaeum cryptofilum OPF8]
MRYPELRESILISAAFLSVTAIILLLTGAISLEIPVSEEKKVGTIKLPDPVLKGSISVEEAISKRRSVREYKDEPLRLEELGQLLWAAQGITSPKGFRAAPSAGATYPLEIYVSVKERGVIGLPAGIYHYDPFDHSLTLIKEGDHSLEIYRASLNQEWVKEAPICIIIAADFSRTTSRYGARGERYVYMEAGHVGQNIYLQATVLDLGTVAVGAFYDDQLRSIIGCEEAPIYIFPVGRK